MTTPTDLFAEARARLTIQKCWVLLDLPGVPKLSCRSPFREDQTPSLSIYDKGKAWIDHGTREGGDVIEFIRHAIGSDHRAVRNWLRERLDEFDICQTPRTCATVKAPQQANLIQCPSDLIEGTQSTWEGFAKHRGLTFPAVHVLVAAGILRFCRIDGIKCFVITDNSRRCAEIRHTEKSLFGKSKVYPLPGVDKSWLPGADLLAGVPAHVSILITEGATDLLAAFDLLTRYKREFGGIHSWVPVALLGASCKALSPNCAALMRGRHVRLVPDADAAGDRMLAHWTDLLRRNGCTVDCVTLPRGTDLSDNLAKMDPISLFSK